MTPSYAPAEQIKLWQHDRFGLFIHWGIYSMYGTNEWCRYYEKVSDEEYQFFFENFNPDLFDPAKWAVAAKAAGMKYVVFTTKHHDGFCMWDTKFTDYKVTNTPCGRDLLREVVDAFRAEGFKIGLYYSLIDWHHPDFTVDKFHHLHDRSAEEKAKLNEGRDMKRYAKYMRDQVSELLTEFGDIVELWFDFCYPTAEGGGKSKEEYESEKMIELIRSLQPNVILNNRLDIPESADILTPENYLRDSDCVNEQGESVPWEGCHTLSAAWGYNRDEKSYFKTPFRYLEMLITQTSLNGNTLYNVGPTARGYLSDREMETLAFIAHWMKYNARSIYGCGAAPKELPPPPHDCRYTYNPTLNRLYIHLTNWPTGNLVLHGLAGKLKHAQVLCDDSRVQILKADNSIHENLNPRIPADAVGLRLMSAPENMPIPVIECFLEA